MSPDLKAKELVFEYYDIVDKITFKEAKECAIKLVDKLIEVSSISKICLEETTAYEIRHYTEQYYWERVKEEIQKL